MTTSREIDNAFVTSDESVNDSNLNRKCYSKHEAIHKWGLKFTGYINDMSIYEFLDRVTEMRFAR